MLLGYPSSGNIYTSSKLTDIANYYGLYIQDDFRVTAKLTINIGMRWEHEPGVYEQNNGMIVNFNGTVANPLAANVTGISPKGEVVYAGQRAERTVGNPYDQQMGSAVGRGLSAELEDRAARRLRHLLRSAVRAGSPIATVGYNQTTSYIASTDNNVTRPGSLSNPFPSGIIQPVGNSLGVNRYRPVLLAGRPERQVALRGAVLARCSARNEVGIAMEVGYVGSRSKHLTLGAASINENALDPSLLSMGSALTQSVANPFYGHGGAGVVGTAKVSEAQLLLPYPTYGSISKLFTDNNKAKYDSLV